MTIKLPAQLATVSTYVAFIAPVTSSELQDGITEKVRIIRTGPSYGEMTLATKKVLKQKASLKVRNLNGSPFYGLTRRAGDSEPDLLARGALILQMFANQAPRRYSIPVERYCDEETVLAQEMMMESEERALSALARTEEGRRLIKEYGIQNGMFRAGLLLKKAPSPDDSGTAPRSLKGKDDPFWTEFRNNLGVHLDASKITQSKLDVMIGVYRGHLSHLKCGSSTKLPTDDQLVRLAKILNILPSDLHLEFSRLDQRLIEEIGSDRAPTDPRPVPDVSVEAKESDQAPVAAPAGSMTSEMPEEPTVVSAQPANEPTLIEEPPVETDPTPNEQAPSRAVKPSGLFSVKMSRSPCASQVRLNVEADVPYEVGVRIMDLINEAAA